MTWAAAAPVPGHAVGGADPAPGTLWAWLYITPAPWMAWAGRMPLLRPGQGFCCACGPGCCAAPFLRLRSGCGWPGQLPRLRFRRDCFRAGALGSVGGTVAALARCFAVGMSSRGCKAEEEREYRVSEPRQHPQGFTEYRVTARIISKKAADVIEITVFKRYSDFKKLHSELSYIHRNLFRKSEEFPAFPRAQVFGRFDEAVIEERRRCAEEMLQFTVNIPALYNSPQLKDFFKDGEVSRPLELAAANDAPSLPAPLIPLPSAEGEMPGSWPSLSPGWPVSGGLPQPLSRSESDGGGEAVHASLHGPSPFGPAPHSPPRQTPATVDELDPGQSQEEETNSPFDSGTEEERVEAQLQTGSHLCDTELALFDPCAKEGVEFLPDASQQSNLVALTVAQSSTLHTDEHLDDLERRLLHLRVQPDNGISESEHQGPDGLDGADYLRAAADCIKEALEREATREYEAAFNCYRNGVDILLKGVQGDLSAERRDAVKKKTAEYLKHAETIFTLHLKDSLPTDVTPST